MMMMIVITTLKVKVNLQRIQLGTDHLTCIEEGYGFFFRSEFFFPDNTRVRIFIFFVHKANFFFPKFNIMLYDKNSESDYFFFLHQNQNIFSATLGFKATLRIRIFFFRKKNFKLNGRSLSDMLINVFYKSILNKLNTFSCLFCPLN